MHSDFFKYLGKEIGWLLLERMLTSLRSDTDIITLQRRAEFMGRLGFALVRSRRQLLLSNLRIALPDSGQAELVTTAKEISCPLRRGSTGEIEQSSQG